MRLRTAAAGGAVLALALTLSACTKNTGQHDTAGNTRTSTGVIDTNPKDSLGPAAEVPDARKGGTFYVLKQAKISHLDPQRIYSFVGLMTAPLYSRSLTTWKDDGKGHLTLVGDLATTPGTDVNKDCKTWQFTIKDGLKFEDGTAITAKDIAYGIARSFDPDLTGGPTYLQEWLANTPQFDTAWHFTPKAAALPPGLTAPDDKTLRFEFKMPHCDLPFAASLPSSAPLEPDKDTGVNLDSQPLSSGPYRVTKNVPGVELDLERNQYWDPATDPVRHQYPDKFVFSFGPDRDAANNRMISDSGPDQSALAWDDVPSSLMARVVGDTNLHDQVLTSPTPSEARLSINVQRVTDLSVRQALNYAIDRSDLIKTLGGPTVASPVTTLMPPGTIGYQQYDAYPAGDTGDIAKAKQLLAGKTPELVLGSADDSVDLEIATQLKNNLEKAGFKITVKPIPEDSKLDETKEKNNPWDLYVDNWAADWPSGASILPPLFDGRKIQDSGNSDTSYVDDPAIDSEFDRVLALDPAKQGPEWAKLDQRIMKELAPAVPLYVDVRYELHGSKAGGLFIGSVFGYPAFTNAFVKA
ncbi:ABC transporter substrate-binding protein [Rugosimonospora acidiphila]|uniref:ABC transporter substrate-binding protein n=1 Tax=Rugosimonospora acidiphila TaxID=556531 RepID=A0ABP9S7Q1_9ACTN